MKRIGPGVAHAGILFVTAVVIAAPVCIRVTFDPCDPPGNCGTSSEVVVCENSWAAQPGGRFRLDGDWVAEKQRCYKFKNTIVGNCTTVYPGYKKVPNCVTGTITCCYYDPENNPPEDIEGPLTIFRPPTLAYCVGTGTPVYPF